MKNSKNMDSNRIFKLISNSKEFISEIRKQLENIPLKKIIKYWQKQNNSAKCQNEINEMVKCNIFPEKFADGKVFSVSNFRHISQQAVLNYIKENNTWTKQKKKQLIDCYTSFIDWLNTISFDWFKTELPTYQMSPHAVGKTLTFSEFRKFIEMLYEKNSRDELIARIEAKRKNAIAVFRLNAYSDLNHGKQSERFLGANIYETFADCIFYDYTKDVKKAVENNHSNYFITLSYNENMTDSEIQSYVDSGINVAVVFEKIPETYLGLPCFNGDNDDNRYLDPKGHIIALKFKGSKKKLLGAIADGFCVPKFATEFA